MAFEKVALMRATSGKAVKKIAAKKFQKLVASRYSSYILVYCFSSKIKIKRSHFGGLTFEDLE